MSDREPVLHIYPLTTEHGDVSIVGNRSGLELLRDAVIAALEDTEADGRLFAADGEAYDLEIVVQPGDCHSEKWEGWEAPYFERRKW